MLIQRLQFITNWLSGEFFSNKSIENVYDTVSRDNKYDRSVNFEKRTKGFKRILAHVKLDKGTVLDLACGTGAIEVALKDRNMHILGIDNSSGMLEIAQRKLKRWKNISFKKGNFMTVDLPNNRFDLITIAHAIRFVPQDSGEKFAQKIYHLLKNGGYFVVIVHDDNFFVRSYYTLLSLLGANKKLNFPFQLKNILIEKLRPFFVSQEVVPAHNNFFDYKDIGLIFKKIDKL